MSMTKSRRRRRAGHKKRMGIGKTHEILVGHCEGKRQLGRSKNKWEDPMKANLKVTEWGGVLGTYLQTTLSHSTFINQFLYNENSLSLSLSLWLYSHFVGFWLLFQFLNPIGSR
jgi:hypothetical protein